VPAGQILSTAAIDGANLPAGATVHELEVAVGFQIEYRPDTQGVTTLPAAHELPAGQV